MTRQPGSFASSADRRCGTRAGHRHRRHHRCPRHCCRLRSCASAVQLGTAYLFSPEANISALHRAALAEAHDDSTVLTNVFTGGPRAASSIARSRSFDHRQGCAGFPACSDRHRPLRAAAEKKGISDFSPLWAGQAVALGHHATAAEDLTRNLMAEAEALLRDLSRDCNGQSVSYSDGNTPFVVVGQLRPSLSSPRERRPSTFFTTKTSWMPAFAGMTILQSSAGEMSRRKPHGYIDGERAVRGQRAVDAMAFEPRGGRFDHGIVRRVQHDIAQSGALVVGVARAFALPDIGGDMVMVAAGRHEHRAVITLRVTSSPSAAL